MALRLCTTVESLYSQVRNIFPHISLRDLPCHRTKKILLLHQVSLKLWSVVVCHDFITDLALSLSASLIYVVKKLCEFSQINVFHEKFPSKFHVFCFACQFDIVHNTLIEMVLVLG